MEHLTARINTTSTSYFLKGQVGPGATIIFIHGFPFNKTIWKTQIEQLPEGIGAIAYDIRGFGQSTTDHLFFSIDLFAQDLIELIEELKLDQCILCGISMGGYIALKAFELSKEKIKGLILSDTNCVADSNESKQKRFAAINQLLAGGKKEFTSGFIKNVFSEDTLATKPEVVAYLNEVISGTSDKTICAAHLALASRTDTSKSLSEINVPVLILRGADDKLMSVEQTKQLKEGIRDSELITITKSGHLPNLENPQEFNAAINSYLSKHFLS